MILFKNDYDTQKVIFDTDSTNISFVKMHHILKRMGVQNDKFFLTLTQPELLGYNPFNPKDKSVELKVRCAVECKTNPWYYFREIVRLPAQASENIPFILNRANLAQLWLFYNDVDSFVTIARQIGKTVGALAIESWLIYIAGFHINVGIFNKDNDLLKENVSRLKSIKESIPPFILFPTIKDVDNKEGLSYAQLENEFKTFVAQSDKRAAEGQGRGHTLIVQHWDEFAYYVNNKLSHQSALATSDTAQRQARAAGLPCAHMITTTAGKLQDPSGKYAHDIRMGCLRFAEWLYDLKDRESLKDILVAQTTNHMVYVEFGYKQLGFDDKWLAIVTRNKTPEVIAVDYFNQWQHGTVDSALPKHLLDKIASNKKDPFTCSYFDMLLIRWFVDPVMIKSPEYANRVYIIGSDTSDNIGRDFTTMSMIDASNMATVATFRCNLANWVHVAACVCKLMSDFPRAILIPERNKNGAVLVDMVIESLRGKGFDPLRRIFNNYYQNPQDNVDLSSLDYGSGLIRKNFGFNTGEKSRDLVYKSVMITALELNYDKMYDSDLIDEFTGLALRNGRIDHGEGSHDDLAYAYLLACFFILQGKNHYMYGIDKSEILSCIDYRGAEIDPIEKQRQQQIVERIKQLEGLIERNRSPLHQQAFTRELKHLRTMVSEDLIDMTNIAADQIRQDTVEHLSRQGLSSSTPMSVLRSLF